MELCSDYSPKRNRTSMCKTTDEPMGIPVPLPSVLPPMENWYIVARKIKTGTCSIYSSWKNYEDETEIGSSSASKTKISPKKKRTAEDASTTELAAFPTVAQAIAYVKNMGPQTPGTPAASSSSITVELSPASNSLDDNQTTKSTPSSVPSEGSASKKRKVDLQSIPTFTNRPLKMSTTSDTIDIGAPLKGKKQEPMSSLDALAMAASARPSKNSARESILEATKAATIVETLKKPNEKDEARLSPAELLQAAIPKGGFKTFSDGKVGRSVVVPNLAARTISKQEEQRKKLLMETLKQKEDEALVRQIKEGEQTIRILEARKESLSVPRSRTPLSDLKIPEVPRGFVSNASGLQTVPDLQSSIDRKVMMGSAFPGMGSTALSSRLAEFDYPLGSRQYSQQLQQQQHLQKLRDETSMYLNKANLLSMQLQSSRNPLIQHLRGNGQQSNYRERLQQSAMIDLASASSDSEHSKMTLKRRNGPSSEASSPLTMGAASMLSKKKESK